MSRVYFVMAAAALLLAALALPGAAAHADAGAPSVYLVVLEGTTKADGSFQISETDRQAALSLARSSGGVIVRDMSREMGVVIATAATAGYAETLAASPLIAEAAVDYVWKSGPSYSELVAQGLATFSHATPGQDAPEPSADPLEGLQWNMQMINTEAAHAKQAGIRAVEVGVLDTGIDGFHPDFADNGIGGPSNVNCAKGRDSIGTVADVLELNPVDIGTPDPCQDNGFHGTHVAGIIAAQANGVGMVGVAPNVELIPVKVCDATTYCYASAVIDGIYYAGRMKFEVINMSFFVDDDSFQQSHQYKCSSDPVQRAFRHGVERAIQYARNRGVTPVAALGNSANDVAHPPEPYENECDIVPAETQGVIGVSALDNGSELSSYSNYGEGMNDVSAPGGETTGNCTRAVPSTFPVALGSYNCISGTSMASPHVAGVAALIISQYGKLGSFDHDGDRTTPPLPDWEMPPQQVESYMQSTVVDIGLTGYDECYGHGRIDALKSVFHDTSRVYEPEVCTWYATQP